MSTFVEDNKDAHELVEDSKGSNGTPETDVVNFVYDAELEKRLSCSNDGQCVGTKLTRDKSSAQDRLASCSNCLVNGKFGITARWTRLTLFSRSSTVGGPAVAR
jgi:hypothetical protein